MVHNIGAEVSLVAYNGKSMRTAKAEGFITGEVVKVKSRYVWIRNYSDNTIWKAVR